MTHLSLVALKADGTRFVSFSIPITGHPRARVVQLIKEGSAETWIVGCQSEAGDRQAQALAARGVKIIGVADDDGHLTSAAMPGHREIVSLLVEGGPTVHGAFFDHGCKQGARICGAVREGVKARSAVEVLSFTPDESLKLEKLKIDKAGTIYG